MNNLKLWRFISLAFLSPIWYNDDAKALDAVATDAQTKEKVIEIFYGDIKDIKRKDIGKYIVESLRMDKNSGMHGIPALFKITGDFEDDWSEKCDISDTITMRAAGSIFSGQNKVFTLSYSEETSDNQPRLITTVKNPSVEIDIHFSCARNNLHYKFTDSHFILIDNLDNIKSDDIGKCFFASLNGLPVLLEITGEMPLNWSHRSHEVKTLLSDEGAKLMLLFDADDQQVGSPFVIMFYGQK